VRQPLLPTLKLYLFIFQNLYQKGNEPIISFPLFLEFRNPISFDIEVYFARNYSIMAIYRFLSKR